MLKSYKTRLYRSVLDWIPEQLIQVMMIGKMLLRTKYDDLPRIVHEWRHVMNLLRPLCEREMILDVGAGRGRYSIPLARKGIRIIAVDISVDALRFIENLKLKNVDLVQADAQCLPFRCGIFQKALMIQVLEHLDSDRRALSEISRILQHEGELIVSVPIEIEVTKLRARFDYMYWCDFEGFGHKRYYTADGLMFLLSCLDLRIAEMQFCLFLPTLLAYELNHKAHEKIRLILHPIFFLLISLFDIIPFIRKYPYVVIIKVTKNKQDKT
ncbi:MAG: class I SAM-dependent methyltransferase [archaeon]|nr:class I SAM-dependent methyltransferase [archaeon]